MKKLFCVFLAVMMAACCVFASAEGLAGGWTIPESTEVTDDALEAFDKAMEGFAGASYEPVALIGTQVVAGLNYCFLCRGTLVVPGADQFLALVYVYADLTGGAQVLQIRDLELGLSYAEEEYEEEDGQNPVMNFIGDYADENGRASLNIAAEGGAGSTRACVTVEWANSAFDGVRWTLYGDLDPEAMIISYQEGVVEEYVCDEQGNITYTPANLAVSGEFVLEEDGGILWNDFAENAGEGCHFVWAGI